MNNIIFPCVKCIYKKDSKQSLIKLKPQINKEVIYRKSNDNNDNNLYNLLQSNQTLELIDNINVTYDTNYHNDTIEEKGISDEFKIIDYPYEKNEKKEKNNIHHNSKQSESDCSSIIHNDNDYNLVIESKIEKKSRESMTQLHHDKKRQIYRNINKKEMKSGKSKNYSNYKIITKMNSTFYSSKNNTMKNKNKIKFKDKYINDIYINPILNKTNKYTKQVKQNIIHNMIKSNPKETKIKVKRSIPKGNNDRFNNLISIRDIIKINNKLKVRKKHNITDINDETFNKQNALNKKQNNLVKSLNKNKDIKKENPFIEKKQKNKEKISKSVSNIINNFLIIKK